MSKSVGSRIKELRELLGYSQTDFADAVNVSKQTLYKYENDIVTNIPSDKIEEMARALHVTPSYLMGWTSINDGYLKACIENDDTDWDKVMPYLDKASIDQKAMVLYHLYQKASPEARKAVEVLLKFEPPQS